MHCEDRTEQINCQRNRQQVRINPKYQCQATDHFQQDHQISENPWQSQRFKKGSGTWQGKDKNLETRMDQEKQAGSDAQQKRCSCSFGVVASGRHGGSRNKGKPGLVSMETL